MMTIKTYKIKNSVGDRITISNYGARIVNWQTHINSGTRNIVIGYENINDYLNDPFYIGAIVGPYANRISNAQSIVNGNNVFLTANEGSHHLHGGNSAMADIFWLCKQESKDTLTLTCKLNDNYNGYPGCITVEVVYLILDNSELKITITARVEKTTIVGPTAHPYFNLNCNQNSNQHSIQISSDYHTPINDEGIPTGEIAPTKNTIYDFCTPKTISDSYEAPKLDNNFLISQTDTTKKKDLYYHASLHSEDKKLTLVTKSNYPALQVYTGHFLQAPFRARQGICLEPQFSPDSPNQASFPFHLTKPDKPLISIISYQLIKH